MHKDTIKKICEAYQIGTPLSAALSCSGGLLHRTYKLDTTKGHFIVKVLNPVIIKRADFRKRYRSTEAIAKEIGKHLPVITALNMMDDPYFTVDNTTVMLFPYFNGTILQQAVIKPQHVSQIAQALAQIHGVNKTFIHTPSVETVPLNVAQYQNHPQLSPETTANMKASSSVINAIYKDYEKHEHILQQNLVVSHRDCDPKNVLWAENVFFIIDWESAGLINRTKDCLATAIYWSLDSNFIINTHYLSIFLKCYQKYQHISHEEARAGLLGFLADWLLWLDFNVGRIINSPVHSDEYILGNKEANQTMYALPIIWKQISGIIALLRAL